MTWVVRHAASCYRRFHIGSDGKTPNERILGRKSGGPIAQFSEAIWWMPLHPQGRPDALDRRYQPGWFFGYADGSNTCFVMTTEGVVRSRSICRRPINERWDASVLACHNSVLQPNPLRPGEIRVGVKCPVLIDPAPPSDPTTGGEVSDPLSRGVQRTRLMRQENLNDPSDGN